MSEIKGRAERIRFFRYLPFFCEISGSVIIVAITAVSIVAITAVSIVVVIAAVSTIVITAVSFPGFAITTVRVIFSDIAVISAAVRRSGAGRSFIRISAVSVA